MCAKKFQLTLDSTLEDAKTALKDGHIDADVYTEWYTDYVKRQMFAGDGHCGIGRADFFAYAQPISVAVGDSKGIATVNLDKGDNSLGWFYGEKATLMIHGKPVKVQVGVNITVVNSKPKKA